MLGFRAADARRKSVITVGLRDADIVGDDNRAIQTAIGRVARTGGGTVRIKPGTYTLYNSVMLASHVRLEGSGPEKTLLRKGPGVASPLADDANFGEYQATVDEATGFAPGMGVAVIDSVYPGDLPTPVLFGYTAYPPSLRMGVRIEGKTLFFDHYLQNTYKVEFGGRVANAFPLCGRLRRRRRNRRRPGGRRQSKGDPIARGPHGSHLLPEFEKVHSAQLHGSQLRRRRH